MSDPKQEKMLRAIVDSKVVIDVLAPAGEALELVPLSYRQVVKQRVQPVVVSAIHGYAILFIFNYVLNGFSPDDQNRQIAIGAGIFAATSWAKDALGTGQLQSIKDTSKEVVARAITPFVVILGGGYLYDSKVKMLLDNLLGVGGFGQELGEKVGFVTLCWSIKVLLFKTGLEKLSYHAKDFDWPKLAAEQAVVYPIQLIFIAFASYFESQDNTPENSLFYTAAIVISIFHVLALLGLEDVLAACFRKGCSAKQSGQEEYVALGNDEDANQPGQKGLGNDEVVMRGSLFSKAGGKKEGGEIKGLMKGEQIDGYGTV